MSSSHNTTERFLDELCERLSGNDMKRFMVDIKYLDMDNAMAARLGQSLKNNTMVTSIALRLSGLEHRPTSTTALLEELLTFLQTATQLKEVTFHGAYFSETANPTIVELFVQAVARNPSVEKVILERIHCLTVNGCMKELLLSSSSSNDSSCHLKHLEMLSCNFVLPTNTTTKQKEQMALARIVRSNNSLEYFHASSVHDTWLVPILLHLPNTVRYLHIASGTAITSMALRHLFLQPKQTQTQTQTQTHQIRHLHLSKWTFLQGNNNPFGIIAQGLMQSSSSSVEKLTLEACCLDDASTKAFEQLFTTTTTTTTSTTTTQSNKNNNNGKQKTRIQSLCLGNRMKFGLQNNNTTNNADVLIRLLSSSHLLELDIEYMTLGIAQWKEFCQALQKSHLQYLSCGYILGDERCHEFFQALPLVQRSLQRIQLNFFPSVSHLKQDMMTAFTKNCTLQIIDIPHAPFLTISDLEQLQQIANRNRCFQQSVVCPDQITHTSYWPYIWTRAVKDGSSHHKNEIIYQSLMGVMGSHQHASTFCGHTK